MSPLDRLLWIELHWKGTGEPPYRRLALLARDRGFYSKNTNIGDIVAAFSHAWRHREKIRREAPEGEWEI